MADITKKRHTFRGGVRNKPKPIRVFRASEGEAPARPAKPHEGAPDTSSMEAKLAAEAARWQRSRSHTKE